MQPKNTHNPIEVLEELKKLFDYDEINGGFIWKSLPYKASKEILGKKAGRGDSRGYRMIRIFGCSYKEHRLVWLWHNGKWPKEIIDHINFNKSDNRIENLRECTSSQSNSHRTHKGNAPIGSRKRKKGTYRAKITKDGKTVDVGGFASIDDAHKEYVRLSLELHKEFSVYWDSEKP